MGFEKINAKRKKLKAEREALIKSKGRKAEEKKYIQYMYNKYPDSQRLTEANRCIFAVPNYVIEEIQDYKKFSTLMLLAKQTMGTQSYDVEYETRLVNVDMLVSTLTTDRTGKYKRELLKTLLELQEDGTIRTEPMLTEKTKSHELFTAYFEIGERFTTFDERKIQNILLSDESVSNKLKMMRVLASVCSYMFYQDPNGVADSEKPRNSVCFENIDKLAESSGMNERATQTFLDKLVELDVLAKFRVNWGGNIKNYYSKREESYYLIKYIEEQLTSGEVKYVEDDIKELSKDAEKQDVIKTEVTQVEETEQTNAVITQYSITVDTSTVKEDEQKRFDKGFSKFRKDLGLMAKNYTSLELLKMYEDKQERERELVGVGAVGDYCFDDNDFKDLF